MAKLFGTKRPRGRLTKVVFASYGMFDSNSAGHVAGFADGLVELGYKVAVCGGGWPERAYAFGDPKFEFFTLDDLTRDPQGIMAFDGTFDPRGTAMICWTPRESVRRAAAPAIARWNLPYLVHLEDNEAHIADQVLARLGRRPKPFPAGLTDPMQIDGFLGGAAGVTVIAEPLKAVTPEHVPTLLLEPGVDYDLFAEPLDPLRRATLRRLAGVPEGASVIVYSGNVHDSNVEEVRTLYEAIWVLRGRGRNLVLVRTGIDASEASFLQAGPNEGVHKLGHLERRILVDVVRSADLFVQPGGPGAFNDYRLPSKLPEFMAAGKPLITSATNLGVYLTDGVDALLLHDSSAEEIAAHLDRLLDDPALASRLGKAAQAFAKQRFRWPDQARKLDAFLRRVVETRA
jgi:glycosyltransferase involved in cell wall biosynthesis